MVELPGVIAVDPLAATLPMPGWMFTEAALVTLQLKMAEDPAVMLFGDALKEVIVGIPPDAGGGVALVPETSTCVVALVLPAGLEAVKVYIVLAVGAIALVPLRATFPIPLSRLTLVAPETLQLSVEVLPDKIVGGLALNELTTGFCSGVVVVGAAGMYMQPHVNIKIEIITSNSFFIIRILPFYSIGISPPKRVNKLLSTHILNKAGQICQNYILANCRIPMRRLFLLRPG
jgi:hypothetical protein